VDWHRAGERFNRRQGEAEGLSKKGDRYLRSLLINGAMAIVRQAEIRPDKHPWVTKLRGRMSKNAIANKTARISWAIMVKRDVYEVGTRPPMDNEIRRSCYASRAAFISRAKAAERDGAPHRCTQPPC
jgi:hypothetical protein